MPPSAVRGSYALYFPSRTEILRKIFFPVKGFPPWHLPIQIDLFIQLFQVEFGHCIHNDQHFLALVDLRLDVREIRVQDLSTTSPFAMYCHRSSLKINSVMMLSPKREFG